MHAAVIFRKLHQSSTKSTKALHEELLESHYEVDNIHPYAATKNQPVRKIFPSKLKYK